MNNKKINIGYIVVIVIISILYIATYLAYKDIKPLRQFHGEFRAVDNYSAVRMVVYDEPNSEAFTFKVFKVSNTGEKTLIDDGTWKEIKENYNGFIPKRSQKIYELKGKYRTTLIDLSARGFQYHVDYLNSTFLFEQSNPFVLNEINYSIPPGY